MLDEYLRRKAALYDAGSAFRCVDGCKCPGCRSPLIVSASLLEIHAQARFLGMSTFTLFRRCYRIAPFLGEGFRRVRVRFVLNKPCYFHSGDRCSLYPVRPASCALFPEYLLMTEPDDSLAGREEFDDYPCLTKPSPIPTERRTALASLMNLFEREVYAAEFYLFGYVGFAIDLREMVGADLVRGRPIPFDRVAKMFNDSIRHEGIYDSIVKGIDELDEKASSYLSYIESIEDILREGGKWNTRTA